MKNQTIDEVRDEILYSGGGRDDVVPPPQRVWAMIEALERATRCKGAKQRDLYSRRFLKLVFGVSSTKEMGARDLYALVRWCEYKNESHIAATIRRVEEAAGASAGQLSLFGHIEDKEAKQ